MANHAYRSTTGTELLMSTRS